MKLHDAINTMSGAIQLTPGHYIIVLQGGHDEDHLLSVIAARQGECDPVGGFKIASAREAQLQLGDQADVMGWHPFRMEEGTQADDSIRQSTVTLAKQAFSERDGIMPSIDAVFGILEHQTSFALSMGQLGEQARSCHTCWRRWLIACMLDATEDDGKPTFAYNPVRNEWYFVPWVLWATTRTDNPIMTRDDLVDRLTQVADGLKQHDSFRAVFGE